MVKIASIIIFASVLAACASGSAVVTGPKRQPVVASEVKLYSKAPAEYEVIGIVKAASEMGLTEQGSMDYAVEELKKRAGAIGANGVLLTNVGEKAGSVYGTIISDGSGGGTFFGSGDGAQSVSGEAIYVTKTE